jgi:catechol 2,3-dioxygenase-like lactoylglutathione lyase family enzyme
MGDQTMPKMKLDAVSVASGDLAATAKFYALLGFTFPEFGAEEKHLEAITPPGEVRLMIDDRGLIQSIIGKAPMPPNHSSFAIKCDSPAEVDNAVKRVRSAGYVVVREPWDAFWGQRYAILADPDGYMVDVFAALS